MDRSILLESLTTHRQSLINKIKKKYNTNSDNMYSVLLLKSSSNVKMSKKKIPNDNNIESLVSTLCSKSQRNIIRNRVRDVVLDDSATMKTGVNCTRCGEPSVETTHVQLRSGDEGATLIRECKSCGARS